MWHSASDRPRSAPRFVVVANPGGRRAELFAAAVTAAGLPAPRVVGWADLLAGRANLSAVVRAGDAVRLESPGRDFEVERAILALGADCDDEEDPDQRRYERLDPTAVAALAFDKGRILAPRQWFLGFRALLGRVAAQLVLAPPHQLLNGTADVAAMFDKRACHARLSAAGVPVPPALPGQDKASPGPPLCGFDDLVARLRDAGWRRVFVKPAHGSSGSGVVAYQVAPAGGHQAVTTVEMVRAAGELRLYNSRRLRTYRDGRQVKDLFDALARHRPHVEQWVPKAGIDGRTFDLRVVVTGGRAGHAVVRLSRSPITNLHLLNDRADPAAVRRRTGEPAWAAATAACERAMACFPDSLHGGVDLAITADFRHHAVLEVNAFGDLLPGVLHDGHDTYAAQVAAVVGAGARAAIGGSAAEVHA